MTVVGALGLTMAAGGLDLIESVYSDVESRGVLPDPTKQPKLSWERVRTLVPRFEDQTVSINRESVDLLLAVRDKRQFGDISEGLWPPRSGTDLALRRTRLLDWVKHYRRVGDVPLLLEVLRATNEGWDIIFVTNIVAATAVLGRHWFQRWLWLGAFEGDLAHFIAVAKKVSDLAKTRGIQEVQWLWFVESASLSGYRNMPFPGFDPVEETRLLAQGGETHDLFGFSWKQLVKEFLPMAFKAVLWVPFKEWVSQAEWLTGGASSVGRVRLTTADGKSINLKARKNMVADVIELDTLASDAITSAVQVNYTIVKAELGKLRIAVAGDLYTYLKMTWVTFLMNGGYYNWPGNTMDETFTEQTERLAKMLELCTKSFGLPYDYKGFDHQPTTSEILDIVEHVCDHARLNVPYQGQEEFDLVVGNIMSGFKNATIEVRVPGSTNSTFTIEGGVMSGLRWTSLLGNGWNSVVTGMAMKLLKMWGVSTDSVERYIRGDDSAIFTSTWGTAALMNVAYDAIGAIGGEGKFSIRHHEIEFLRVWFDTRCHGYPCRAIPGLTQRKPWSSSPWSEDMVLRALHDGCVTLKRRATERTREIELIWRSLRHVWCQNHSLPDAVSWTPVFSGGYGLEAQPIGSSWHIKPPVPKADKEAGIQIDNQLPWRSETIKAYAKDRYDLDVGDLAQRLARGDLLATIAADNIPDVSRVIRQGWLAQVRTAGCRGYETRTEVAVYTSPVYVDVYTPGQVKDLLSRLKSYAPMFGCCPEVETARSDYQRFRPKMSFRHWVRSYYPRIHSQLGRFHRSWHMSEMLDYLGGRLVCSPSVLHSALIKVLAWIVATAIVPGRRSVRNGTLWAAGVFEPTVAQSPISQETYWW